jgi:SAM-dependent methyltransferase
MTQFVVEFGKVGKPPEPDGRLDAPAFHRNHAPIWSALTPFLKDRSGDVLEVGSGTGQHVVAFAGETPGIVWWPSDSNDKHLASIEAWRRHAALANIRPPLRFDLTDAAWGAPIQSATAPLLAILCANVLHIAPWRVAEGLFGGAARLLQPSGRLFVYGPFMRDGQHTAASNAAFDASLRNTNPEWGVRDVLDLRRLADRAGLVLIDIVEMPANNLILVFEL